MKIAAKIMFAMGVTMALTLILGIASFWGCATLGDLSDNYVNISIPGTIQVYKAQRSIEAMEKLMLETMMVSTPQELNNIESQFTEERNVLLNSLDTLAAISPAFQSKIDQIYSLQEEMAESRNQLLAESRKFTAEGNAKAYQIYINSYEPVFEEVLDYVYDLNDMAETAIANRYANSKSTMYAVYVMIVVIMLVSLVAASIVTKRLSSQMTAPIVQIGKAMHAIRNGNLNDVDVTYESNDELGTLSNDVRAMADLLQRMIPDFSHLCSEMGDGNFMVKSKDLSMYVGDYKEMLMSLVVLRDALSGTIGQIVGASAQLLNGAEQVASGAQSLSSGAAQQASTVEELAASVTEINFQVKKNTENAGQARQITEQTAHGIEQSHDHMNSLMKAMDDIQSTSNEISKIIKNIDDIAFQTNILALNAAVEAARAGAAGKGFAVVADEVRNLAAKSAEAAKNTTTMIENSLSAVQVGVDHARETYEALNTVVVGAQEVKVKVTEISQASEEQLNSLSQISLGIEQISAVTQNTSATAEESAATSQELTSQANMLQHMTEKFTLYVAGSSSVQSDKVAAATPTVRKQEHTYAAAEPAFSSSDKY